MAATRLSFAGRRGLFLLVIFLAACQSPEDKVAAWRKGYQVSLNAWLLKEGAAAPATEPPAAAPRSVEVIFDLLVTHQQAENLPGITLDVSHADPFGKEKRTWRRYLEVPEMIKGKSAQLSFTEKVDNFVEGDTFSVILEKNVAPADRGAYREFAQGQ